MGRYRLTHGKYRAHVKNPDTGMKVTKVYNPGDVVELSDSTAANLSDMLTPADEETLMAAAGASALAPEPEVESGSEPEPEPELEFQHDEGDSEEEPSEEESEDAESEEE